MTLILEPELMLRIAALSMALLSKPVPGQSAAAPHPSSREIHVTQRATGTFEVKLSPQAVHPEAEGLFGRMSLDKQFRGELEGSSRGEMLAASSQSVQGSAGYVAIERVSGTLAGRTGSFMLQHSGTMLRGEGRLVITVIPDTGTGDLEGITGSMQIIIAGGQHSYVFEYTLPER
jgi:hypothetical protein